MLVLAEAPQPLTVLEQSALWTAIRASGPTRRRTSATSWRSGCLPAASPSWTCASCRGQPCGHEPRVPDQGWAYRPRHPRVDGLGTAVGAPLLVEAHRVDDPFTDHSTRAVA